jgi:hypothetical protein
MASFSKQCSLGIEREPLSRALGHLWLFAANPALLTTVLLFKVGVSRPRGKCRACVPHFRQECEWTGIAKW